jgi:hypothetical protein
MVTIDNSYKKLTLDDINKFELQFNLVLPPKYKKFLLESNGGAPEPNVFETGEPGISCVNGLFGIYTGGYEDVGVRMGVFDGRLPNGFIPVGDDPSGNLICLGITHRYYEKIYFWDHEEEPDEPDMSNMHFLADNIYDFLDNLYDED